MKSVYIITNTINNEILDVCDTLEYAVEIKRYLLSKNEDKGSFVSITLKTINKQFESEDPDLDLIRSISKQTGISMIDTELVISTFMDETKYLEKEYKEARQW